MTCTNCETTLTGDLLLGKAEVAGNTDDALEVRFTCPDCGKGFYTFVPLTDFTDDPTEPGKEQS